MAEGDYSISLARLSALNIEFFRLVSLSFQRCAVYRQSRESQFNLQKPD